MKILEKNQQIKAILEICNWKTRLKIEKKWVHKKKNSNKKQHKKNVVGHLK